MSRRNENKAVDEHLGRERSAVFYRDVVAAQEIQL